MTVELTGLCKDHSFETSENVCRRCGLEYCELCLVYPFGTKKPLCKECAMVAGGVRSHGASPEMTKRDLKRRLKAWNARVARTGGGATAAEAAISDPVLNDPLAATREYTDRVPATVPADDGADVAAALSESFREPPPAPKPTPAEEPADGVAPPIDWSQPFG